MLVSVLHFLWLNYIPLYGHITFYFFIHHLVNICVVSNFWFLYIMLLWTFICKYLHECMFSFFLEMEVLGHMGTLGFHVWGTADMFSKAVETALHSHQRVWGFQFLYILIHTCQYLSFYFSYPSGCKVVSHVVLICISLMTSNVEHFSWGYWSFVLFEKCLFKIFAHFKKQLYWGIINTTQKLHMVKVYILMSLDIRKHLWFYHHNQGNKNPSLQCVFVCVCVKNTKHEIYFLNIF